MCSTREVVRKLFGSVTHRADINVDAIWQCLRCFRALGPRMRSQEGGYVAVQSECRLRYT